MKSNSITQSNKLDPNLASEPETDLGKNSFDVSAPIQAVSPQIIDMPELPQFVRVKLRHLKTTLTYPLSKIPDVATEGLNPDDREGAKLPRLERRFIRLAKEIATEINEDIRQAKQDLKWYDEVMAKLVPPNHVGPVRLQNLTVDPFLKTELRELWASISEAPINVRNNSTSLKRFREEVRPYLREYEREKDEKLTPTDKERIITLVAMYCVETTRFKEGTLRRYPLGTFDPTEPGYFVRVQTILQHMFVDRLGLDTPARFERFHSFSKSLQRRGLSDLAAQLSPVDMARVAFPGFVGGENPSIRDWKVNNVERNEHSLSLDTRMKRAAVWELRFGQRVLNADGTLNIEKISSPEVSWPKVIEKGGVLRNCNTVQQFFELVAPGLVGLEKGQMRPWKVLHRLSAPDEMPVQDVSPRGKYAGARWALRIILEKDWGLVDEAGHLDVQGLKKRPSIKAALDREVGVNLPALGILFEKTYPHLIGFGRHQLLPIELHRGHGVKLSELETKEGALKELFLDGLGTFEFKNRRIQWECNSADFEKWRQVKVIGLYDGLSVPLEKAFGARLAGNQAEMRDRFFELLANAKPKEPNTFKTDQHLFDALSQMLPKEWKSVQVLGPYSKDRMSASFGKKSPPIEAETLLFGQLAHSRITLNEIRSAYILSHAAYAFNCPNNQLIPQNVPFAWVAHFAASSAQAADRLVEKRVDEIKRWMGSKATPDYLAVSVWGAKNSSDDATAESCVATERAKIEKAIETLVRHRLYSSLESPVETAIVAGISRNKLRESVGFHPQGRGASDNENQHFSLKQVREVWATAGISLTLQQEVAWQLSYAEKVEAASSLERILRTVTAAKADSWSALVRAQNDALSADAERFQFQKLVQTQGKDLAAWNRLRERVFTDLSEPLSAIIENINQGHTVADALALWASADGEDGPRHTQYLQMLKYVRSVNATFAAVEPNPYLAKQELSRQRGSSYEDPAASALTLLQSISGVTRAEIIESAKLVKNYLNDYLPPRSTRLGKSEVVSPADVSKFLAGETQMVKPVVDPRILRDHTQAMSIYSVWKAGLVDIAVDDCSRASSGVRVALAKIFELRNQPIPQEFSKNIGRSSDNLEDSPLLH